jgi:tetratricopeptide (TPR) repeat protein
MFERSKKLMNLEIPKLINKGYYETAARYLEKMGRFKEARNIWKKLAKDAKKKKRYEDYFHAMVWGLGKLEKYKEIKKLVAQTHEKQGLYLRAALEYCEAGRFEKAKKCYLLEAKKREKAGEISDAIRFYKIAGLRMKDLGKKFK